MSTWYSFIEDESWKLRRVSNHLVTNLADLGWYDAESYGIVYKVRGFCNDGSNPEVFDDVEVTGDILRSHIHHLYFGHYSFGHQGGDFSYNHVSSATRLNAQNAPPGTVHAVIPSLQYQLIPILL